MGNGPMGNGLASACHTKRRNSKTGGKEAPIIAVLADGQIIGDSQYQRYKKHALLYFSCLVMVVFLVFSPMTKRR